MDGLIYEALAAGQFREPSWLVAVLPPGTEPPGITEITALLEDGPTASATTEVPPDREFDDADWEMTARVRLPDEAEPTDYRISLQKSMGVDSFHLEWGCISDTEIETANRSTWSLCLSTTLSDRPLTDYHRQIRVLSVIAPELVLAMDVAACRPHSAAWIREVAQSRTPPPPNSLFSIHAVCPDEGSPGGVWMHTHGLLRCGSIELEMLEIPEDDAPNMCLLLNAVAPLLIESGIPAQNDPFPIGDGISLLWLPWERGIKQVRRLTLGGKPDRDDAHQHPSGVLFAPGRGLLGKKLRSPASYSEMLSDNPLLYISNMETRRMAQLATERLARFTLLAGQHADSEDWAFLVKLGYHIDDHTEDTDREHLWFRVNGVQDNEIDATLINQPYGIARMQEGDRGTHSLDLLSDWTILCEHGQFTPDTVIHLEQALE